MKFEIYNSPISSISTVVDIIDTEKGIIIEILEGSKNLYEKNEILMKFINSIKERYDTGYKGFNEDEFLKETLLPKKEKLIAELRKIELIENIIGKNIRSFDV